MQLKDYLKKRGITPTEFSKITGINRVSIHHYCSGKRFPRPKNVAIIAKKTKQSVTYLDFYNQNL